MNGSNTPKVAKNLTDELNKIPVTAERPLTSPDQEILPASKEKMNIQYNSPEFNMDDVINQINENGEVHAFEKILRTIHAELMDIKAQNNNIKADLASIKEILNSIENQT